MTPTDPLHFISDRPRRILCERCRRPQSACICRWITPVEPVPQVLILQHPMESREAKGSAMLLHLSLKGSRLVAGEKFESEALQRLLHAPLETGRECISPVLLYPDAPGTAPSSERDRPAGIPTDPARLRLVVLDGTWRKSRKQLFLNPMLQTLPRMSLQEVSPSRYRIRKAHAPDQLSTLEAVCQALMQLENDESKYLPLLQAFDGFVDEQLARMPPASR